MDDELRAGIGMVRAGDVIEHQQHTRDRLHDEDEQKDRPEDVGPPGAALDRLLHQLCFEGFEADALVDEVVDLLEQGVHLGDSDLFPLARLKLNIDHLDLARGRDLDRQHVQGARRRTVQDGARHIVDGEMAGAEEHLAAGLV